MNNHLPRPAFRGLTNGLPSLCQSHLAPLCDINNIIKRVISGDTSPIRQCFYGDTTRLPEDTLAMLEAGRHASQLFDSLPANVKAAFPTPSAFVNAFSDPNGIEILCNLGVLKKKEESVPVNPDPNPSKGEPGTPTPTT